MSRHQSNVQSTHRLSLFHRLLLHIKVYWLDAVGDGCVRTVTFDDVYVVFQAVGGLMTVIAGIDDTDEMILGDVMNCLQQVMSETLGEGHHENSIADSENFAKLSICIDEMVPEVRSWIWMLTERGNLAIHFHAQYPLKLLVRIILTRYCIVITGNHRLPYTRDNTKTKQTKKSLNI